MDEQMYRVVSRSCCPASDVFSGVCCVFSVFESLLYLLEQLQQQPD